MKIVVMHGECMIDENIRNRKSENIMWFYYQCNIFSKSDLENLYVNVRYI